MCWKSAQKKTKTKNYGEKFLTLVFSISGLLSDEEGIPGLAAGATAGGNVGLP